MDSRRILLTVSSLALTFYCPPLSAEEPEAREGDDIQSDGADGGEWPDANLQGEVYETEVVGYRLRPTDEVTGHAETIDLEDQHESTQTVSDVVSDATGVEVRRAGGPGAFGGVAIRGSTPNQVPVFLDGVRLSGDGFSGVNLGEFSLDILETIEVYRGNTPLVLGMGGIGGALVLRTRAFRKPVTQITASYGSWNTWRLSTLRQDRIGRIKSLVLFSVGGSEGNFRYLNTFGTIHNENDDEYVDRANNAHTTYNALVKLNAEKGAWEGQLTNELFFMRRGIAGIDSFVGFSSAEVRSVRNSTNLKATRRVGKHAEAVYELSSLVMREDFRDPEGTVGLGYHSTVDESLGFGATALLTGQLNPRNRLTARAALFYENFRQLRLGISTQEQSNPIYRLKPQLGVEYEWNAAHKFFVVPAVRGEMHYSHFEGGPIPALVFDFEPTTTTDFFVSPTLGMRYLVNDVLTLRANGGRYIRAPELAELFGDHGQIVGNPGLREEVGLNADIGLSATWTKTKWMDSLRLDAAAFAGRIDDLITLEQNSPSTVRPSNVESAQVSGLEFAFRMSGLGLFSLRGNYTFFHGTNQSNIPHYKGKKLPGRSPHQVYARVEIKKDLSRVNLVAFYDFDFASRAFTGQYNSADQVSMGRYHGVGGRIGYQPLGLSFTLEIENLTDNLTFRNQSGNTLPMSDYLRYPLPGRSVFGTLHLEIP